MNDTKWCGIKLTKNITGTGPRYQESYLHLTIPTFTSSGAGTLIGIWAGMDNSTLGIIQDGFEYRVIGGVGVYRAWYEYFPNSPVYPSFTIAPGDVLTFWAWEGNSSCSLQVGGGYGCFYWFDATRNTVGGTFKVSAPIGSSFSGLVAEAIAERPTGSPSIPSWSGSIVADFEAMDANGTWHTPTSDPDENHTLVNGGGQTMATATNVGVSDLVTWQFVRAN